MATTYFSLPNPARSLCPSGGNRDDGSPLAVSISPRSKLKPQQRLRRRRNVSTRFATGMGRVLVPGKFKVMMVTMMKGIGLRREYAPLLDGLPGPLRGKQAALCFLPPKPLELSQAVVLGNGLMDFVTFLAWLCLPFSWSSAR